MSFSVLWRPNITLASRLNKPNPLLPQFLQKGTFLSLQRYFFLLIIKDLAGERPLNN
jgi:hypothetical protein